MALQSPRAPFRPKGKKNGGKDKPPPELKSRPRILRTPDGTEVSRNGDHGSGESEEEDDRPDIDAMAIVDGGEVDNNDDGEEEEGDDDVDEDEEEEEDGEEEEEDD